jgi:predicted RNA-binding protein YlxR (DUF448 family)
MQKKIPQRQCMGCRERKEKRQLIRVVRGTDGVVSLDFGGKKNGRGVYLCPDPECLKKAIRSKALDRSLEVTIPQEVYDRLGLEDQYMEILGVRVPMNTIPVTPGRNLAMILEVAAMNNRQRKFGYNSALEFTEKINRHFDENMGSLL